MLQLRHHCADPRRQPNGPACGTSQGRATAAERIIVDTVTGQVMSATTPDFGGDIPRRA